MIETKEIYCVTCPKGCKLTINSADGQIVEVIHGCKRGHDYAHEELTNPKRMVATSVQVNGGVHPLLAVYTAQPVAKSLIHEVLEVLRDVHVQAPVKMGQVIVENVLDSGVNVLASRSIETAT